MSRAVSIQHGIAPSQRAAAACLYWQAFGRKLGRVMGPERRALAFIERVMLPGHAFLALDPGGQVVGVIGFRTPQGAFVGGTYEDLQAVYGRLGALWRSRALSVLAQDLPVGAIIVDGLVVAPEARGQGVGAQLAEALIGWARGEGYRAVLLDVVEGNTQALELYDWLGFRRSGIRRSRLTKAIYGFRTCHEMTLPL